MTLPKKLKLVEAGVPAVAGLQKLAVFFVIGGAIIDPVPANLRDPVLFNESGRKTEGHKFYYSDMR